MKKILLATLLLLPIATLATNGVELNTASLQELDTIVGIGPSLAQRIVDARPFNSVDDLLRVKGIGDKTLQKIKDQGLAYVSGQSVPTAQSSTQNNTTTQSTQATTQETQPTATPITANNPPPPTSTPKTEPAQEISYSSGVFINEILPAPQGADETDEWIELYNSNNSTVDLTGWKIRDSQGTLTTYTLKEPLAAHSYLVLERPTTKIVLNNDGDELHLLWPNNQETDIVAYPKAPKNQSYNQTNGDWQWSTSLTPGSQNNVQAPVVIAKTSLSKNKKSSNNTSVVTTASNNASLADISQPLDGSNKNPWLLFFVALGLTATCGGVVGLIKFIQFKKQTNVRSQSFQDSQSN